MSRRPSAQGYRSRAAFKLTEIDDRHRLLKPGMIVLDLGAAPGGWSQVAAQRVGAGEGKGRVIAVDLSAIEPIPGVEALVLDMSEPRVRRPHQGGARRRARRCRAVGHGGVGDRA